MWLLRFKLIFGLCQRSFAYFVSQRTALEPLLWHQSTLLLWSCISEWILLTFSIPKHENSSPEAQFDKRYYSRSRAQCSSIAAGQGSQSHLTIQEASNLVSWTTWLWQSWEPVLRFGQWLLCSPRIKKALSKQAQVQRKSHHKTFLSKCPSFQGYPLWGLLSEH